MIETRKVFEVKITVERQVEERTEVLIFEKVADEWVYKAPNAQTHTSSQLKQIMMKILELNDMSIDEIPKDVTDKQRKE